MFKNKEWINKQIGQHLLETEGEEYTGYEAGIEFVQLLIEEAEVELNEDQEIVLQYLKSSSGEEGSLTLAITACYNLNKYSIQPERLKKIISAYRSLTRKNEAEVLQAFAEWGLSQND